VADACFNQLQGDPSCLRGGAFTPCRTIYCRRFELNSKSLNVVMSFTGTDIVINDQQAESCQSTISPNLY